jgi:hypothetical protein
MPKTHPIKYINPGINLPSDEHMIQIPYTVPIQNCQALLAIVLDENHHFDTWIRFQIGLFPTRCPKK